MKRPSLRLKLRLALMRRRRYIEWAVLAISLAVGATSIFLELERLDSLFAVASLAGCAVAISIIVGVQGIIRALESALPDRGRTAALSAIYLRRTLNKYVSSLIILSGTILPPAIITLISSLSPKLSINYSDDLKIVIIVIFALAALLLTKVLVLIFRVRRGYFGANKGEAREMIKFIIANSESIDFDDPSGSFRRALEPEAQSTRDTSRGWQGIRV